VADKVAITAATSTTAITHANRALPDCMKSSFAERNSGGGEAAAIEVYL
jgi:hypothetical protein